MIKKKSFTLQTQKSKGWARFQAWTRKWNKIMSVVFSVLVFVLLFAIVVVNTTTKSANENANANQENQENKNLSRSVRAVYACSLSLSNCRITCATEDIDNLIPSVEAAIGNDTDNACSSGYHLLVRQTKFKNEKISPGWFKTTAIINELSIESRNLEIQDIEPDAFNDCTFRSISNFSLRYTAIAALREGAFNGLNNLKKLVLELNTQMRSVDRNVLEPIYQLQELRVEEQLEDLKNLTGKMELKHMRTLSLSKNNFGRIIDANTFVGSTRVETLILAACQIEAIGPGSFDPMVETIKLLDLRHNFLTHLPENLLANMIRPYMQFYLSNNGWHCDCKSLELQGYDINNSSLIIDTPLVCEMPDDVNERHELKSVPLFECEIEIPTEEPLNTSTSTLPTDSTTTSPSNSTTTTTSPSTSTTTTTSPSITPPLPHPFDRVNCYDHTFRYEQNFIDLEKTDQYFDVKQEEIGKVSIKLKNSVPNLAMVIISHSVNKSICQYDVEEDMIFGDLDTRSAHLFCLINKTSHATSPTNCVPFNFNEIKSIWAHDEVIIALVCAIVLALVVGLLIGWLLSYRYQRYFKSKESVKYNLSGRSISKTSTEEYDFSMVSEYQHGKLSMDDTTLRLRRSISENSLASCKSYITAVTPSPFEIIQWKLRKNAMNKNNSNDYHIKDYLEKLEYDHLPPPLPPHPLTLVRDSRRSDKIYETINEPVYTCTSEVVPYKITYMNK